MENNDTEIKQDFLRSEIIDQNYDTEAFLNYLIQIYGEDAADVDRYTMDELKDIIKKFKVNNQPLQPSIDTPIETEKKEEIKQNENNNVNKSDEINKLKRRKTEFYEDVINGDKIILSPISFQKFSVTVGNPEKIDGGFFSKAYVIYLVTTEAFNFSVKRRYSDFEWLREIFSEQFPNLIIPPIPLKNFSDRFNEEFIEKRKRYLQKFIHNIDNNPILANTAIYYDFISCKSEDEFNTKKKHHSKTKAPNKLQEVKTIDGSVRIYYLDKL